MPEDSLPKDPQTPKPQPKFNSLDGFTNSPKPAGSPPTNPDSPPNGFGSNPSPLSPKTDIISPPNQPSQRSAFSSGGVTNPTVSGMAGLQNPQKPNLPQLPEPAPQSQAPIITTHKKSHKKLWMSALVLLVLLGLGAGYAFAFYLPNTPDNVYKSSLTNSGLAADKLIDYSRMQQQAHYKSTSFDGKLNVKSPDVSFDASLNGDVSKTDGQVQASADVMGQQVKANVKYITKSGNDAPDIYVQASGAKTFLNQNGLGAYAKLDGKWIAIDHTIVDAYRSGLQQAAKAMSNNEANKIKAPTTSQIYDAVNKVQVVNKQYIFSTDPSKAVLTKNQYLGKETVNGRMMYHYKVGYNKAHLKAYITSVCQALDNSQLNDWAKQVDSGSKNISDVINCDTSGNSIDQLKSGYTFDMWADAKTKLIGKLTFTDTANKNDTFSLSQNYTGGVVYPFSVNLASKDDSGNPTNITLGYSVNSATHKVSMTLNANTKDSSGTTTVSGSLNATPSNNSVTVTAPKGAEPVTNVLKSLDLGSVLSGGSNIPACKTGTKCNNQVITPGCSNPYLLLACSTKSNPNDCPASAFCLPISPSPSPGGVNPGGVDCTPANEGISSCPVTSRNST